MKYKTLDTSSISKDNQKRILDIIPAEEKYSYVAATVNNRIRELTYVLKEPSDVKLLDFKDTQAVKIYETSLRYLVAMATHRLYPQLDIRFSYNISRSIFCQILTPGFHTDLKFVDSIQAEMQRLIKADLPIERKLVTREEAAEIYKANHYDDKIDILKYRPDDKVHLYSCDGYVNYLYGYMVPSTGFLTHYKMKLFAPGFIIQYPRAECGGIIPEFEEDRTFGRTLKESYQWAVKVGTETVSKINEYVLKNGSVDFINMCESNHNNMLAELGKKIQQDIDSIRLICIAGPSSSGKTTFANRLRIELLSLGIRPIRISIDDYYKPKSEIPLDEDGEVDLECLQALDTELFNSDMLRLINGEEVQLPRFDFKLGKRVPGRILKVDQNQPIIIEGIHALNDELTPDITKHQKFKIYIAPQAQICLDNHNPLSLTDLRLLRRIVRDNKFRKSSAEETISMWPSVRRGEFKWIYKNQEGADYVFNSLLPYELCVMKKHALPILTKIPNDSPYYIKANRLIKFLKYFVDIDDEVVPNNSLMREFIGGSCFEA
ncbi:phosphoribulokinase/uridine kinase family protein [Clostridium sp. CAG:288]|jgi:uridine kinase|nr:phosphoribulokinase/uridine kinase family protein [Clostridium sp. CAG:288]